MTTKLLLLAGAALAGLACATAARAGSDTKTFTVSATVVASCQVVTVNNLDFGNLTSSSVGSGTDKSTTLSVTCTNGATGVTVALTTASQASATDGSGSFGGDQFGLNKISYGLFQDSAHSIPWGSGTNARSKDDASQNLGTGAAQTLTVYGHIPPQPTVVLTAGQYTDTVTVTVNF